jgi:hypothetical protein
MCKKFSQKQNGTAHLEYLDVDGNIIIVDVRERVLGGGVGFSWPRIHYSSGLL